MGNTGAARQPIGRRFVTVADPGAVDWQFVLPAGFDWKFIIGTALLVCSATAGNRFPGFQVWDNLSGSPGFGGGNRIVYGVPAQWTFGPSTTNDIHYLGSETVEQAQLNQWACPVPSAILPAGWTIGSEVLPKAGDHWSQICFMLEAYAPLQSV
ncbi:MAG TPA: hypothetical protein VF032_19500 [Thermoleophilaceae bacterium]